MSIKHTAKYQQLVTKLREVFLIDRPELNFGIYLILSVPLENRLLKKVQAALAIGNANLI
ncbi:hypothetical protein C5468_17760 [Photorhabdus luminescens subsp. mexicana]|uniref:Uncharacterized protein n=1 Tax=Photorhabdus luminescens subsp. mexicana TaxID=2100167 RepID=A0A4R4J363_PHOLU|nr:hypothetical protein C5468_17760 [Photorhabdus luminescens subsp. mexicana]